VHIKIYIYIYIYLNDNADSDKKASLSAFVPSPHCLRQRTSWCGPVRQELGSSILGGSFTHLGCLPACQPVVILLSRIANALRSNGELTVGFGERGRVKDGADAVLAAALAQAETSRRSVSDNVAANGLGRV
jgi:hypothetical protein